MLGMDKLSHMISKAIEDGVWKPLNIGRNGPGVSHLIFADDLILCGQANINQMECLNLICDISG